MKFADEIAQHPKTSPEDRNRAIGEHTFHWEEYKKAMNEAKRHHAAAMNEARRHHAALENMKKERKTRPLARKIASAVPRLAQEHNTAAREHAKYAPGGPGYLAAKKHYESLARGPAAAPQTIRQRMGSESDKKTNTGRKNADGRTIWRGPRGGAFVMKNGRKVPV